MHGYFWKGEKWRPAYRYGEPQLLPVTSNAGLEDLVLSLQPNGGLNKHSDQLSLQSKSHQVKHKAYPLISGKLEGDLHRSLDVAEGLGVLTDRLGDTVEFGLDS